MATQAITSPINVAKARLKVINVVGTDRQCDFIKKDGQRCKKMSRKGTTTCDRHDTSFKQNFLRERIVSATPLKRWNMPVSFYQRRLGPKLQDFMEETLAAPYAEQRQIYEELALMRATASDCVALYSAAMELQDRTDVSAEMKRDLLLQAGSMMRFALADVVKTAKVAAEIDANGRDKFSAATMHDVTNQIVVMVRTCFDHDPDALMKFDQLLTDELRLPSLGINGEIIGTALTPDQDVTCMDMSVPPK